MIKQFLKYVYRPMLITVVMLFIMHSSQGVFAANSSLVRSLQTQMDETGHLILDIQVPKDKNFQKIANVFLEDGYFQNIIKEINQKFIFPIDIKVEFADAEGPLYDLKTKTIIMSYDFILYLSKLYLDNYPDANKDDLVNFAEGSTTFFLYHELAHALIDVYQIPIVSNEETAADNLAVIIALEYTKDGYNIVMDTADLFDMLDRTNEKYDDDELWDEHALDSQRFYNIICLTYGKYPDKVKKELKDLDNQQLLQFIKEKGDYCIATYQQQFNGWMQLLDIHFMPESQ